MAFGRKKQKQTVRKAEASPNPPSTSADPLPASSSQRPPSPMMVDPPPEPTPQRPPSTRPPTRPPSVALPRRPPSVASSQQSTYHSMDTMTGPSTGSEPSTGRYSARVSRTPSPSGSFRDPPVENEPQSPDES